MTRINLIPPQELWYKHLVAEYRELPRVFGLVRALDERCLFPSIVGIPKRFTLGTGHEKFFYDKLTFLIKRQQLLIDEMLRRGYHPSFGVSSLGNGISSKWFNDWEPDAEAIALSRQRIEQRLEEKVFLSSTMEMHND